MLFEPLLLSGKSVAAFQEWAKNWAGNRAEICKPTALSIGLDMTGTGDTERTQGGQVNRLRVEAPDLPARVNDELHRHLHYVYVGSE